MSYQKTHFFSLLKGSALCGLAAAGLFCVCIPASAQERAGGERRSRFMDRIDQEEGAERLAVFRQQRLDGDFKFEFELQHKPRKSSRTIRYRGSMWGSWNEIGPVTRIQVFPAPRARGEQGMQIEAVELIIQNGVEPQAWIRRTEGGEFKLLHGDALFEPLLPGLLYSPFDLQMPFVYWEDFVYEGPTLVGASRVGQQFLMQPPPGSASAARGISGVRMTLDDDYNALWRIEVVNTDGNAESRFEVEGIKKVQEQYIVKRITLTELPSEDSTSFEVKDASVGISIPRDFFRADPVLDAKANAETDKR